MAGKPVAATNRAFLRCRASPLTRAMAQRSPDPDTIEAEVNRIQSLGLDSLRAEWRGLLRGSAPGRRDLKSNIQVCRPEQTIAAKKTGAHP
jgi:hypothetical protein